MDELRFKELIDAIRGNGDVALTSVEYTELIDGYREMLAKESELTNQIEQLADENGKLREINQQLMLDKGRTITEDEPKQEVEIEIKEDEINDDELIDALGILE